MATSSGDDIPTQLAALLGKKKKVAQIRKTDETPPKISVIDVISAVTGKDARHAAEQLRRLVAQYPDVDSHCVHVKFPDSRGRRGQKDTPASGVRGVVEIVMLLQGHAAAKVRRQAAELLVRYLGGDLALVDEVCKIRGFQEELAFQAPEDPRRVFGEVAEASSSPSSSLMTQALSDMNERLTKQEQILARIYETLEHDRSRVNLNVRAPKRAAPYDHPIARDIAKAGRPLPVAKFLDQKEREDPAWRATRKSFAPTFGMLVQILKKNRLKLEGQPPVYVEQNHRPQLLYTEADRDLMEEAWQLTSAHREDLVQCQGSPQGKALVAHDKPSVMDMLRGV